MTPLEMAQEHRLCQPGRFCRISPDAHTCVMARALLAIHEANESAYKLAVRAPNNLHRLDVYEAHVEGIGAALEGKS